MGHPIYQPVEASAQVVGCFFHYGCNGVVRSQTLCVAVTAIYHEAQVVRTGVVSYNNDGTVEKKQTFQGKNDDSSWARGQAWAVYGYTACYRETQDTTFLNFAVKVADMIMNRVKTDDAIPYWDYDAPVTEETPRDASAASVTASALIELSTMVPDGKKYLDYAEKILKSLSGDAYLAKVGENQGFILMHSTGSLPNGSEIDTPLNYADYYYLEALKRFMDLKGISYKNL